MISPALLAVIIYAAAAVLEGALAGKGARQRLAQLRIPPYSPPFALWLVIGFLFYADVARKFAPGAQHWACVALTAPCARADGCGPTRERVLEPAVLPVAQSSRELHRIRALCGARRRAGHRSRQDLFSRWYLAFVLLHLSYLCYSMGLSPVAI
jgi:hypothetical protein